MFLAVIYLVESTACMLKFLMRYVCSIVQGIPFLLDFHTCSKHQIHLASTIYLTLNFILLTIGHFAAQRGEAGLVKSVSAYAHAQLSTLGRTCTSWLIIDFVNQLARETQLYNSLARNGSQEKRLRIESPLSEKHPLATVTFESS